MTPSKEERLCKFLAEAFSPDELRRWIAFKYPAVSPDLPAEATPAAYAFAVVEAARKRGLIGAGFFDHLLTERPRLRAELDELRKDWSDHWVADPSHTAIILDRVLQWNELHTTCDEDPRHIIILVHGDRDQDLDLFLLRIKHFLNDKCARRHRIVPVGRTRDNSAAVTAEDWTRNLCTASGYPNNDLAVALERATRASAVLFILEDAKKPLKDLGAADFAGLTEFFCDAFHSAVVAVRPVHPVRLIVPVDHSHDRKNVCRALDALAKRIRALAHLTVVQPKELDFPSLEELRDHVIEQIPDLDPVKWARCAELYHRVEKQHRRTLRDLADPLDDLISAWMQDRAKLRQESP